MPEPTRAVFDYGSNSLRVIVCPVSEKGVGEPVLDEQRIIRLGKHVVRSGKLKKKDVERAMVATEELLARVQQLQPDSIDAVGTWALRAARNPKKLLKKLRKRYNLGVRLLSGEEEAAACYLAVRGQVGPGKPLATLDMGGGSSELTWGEGALPEWVKSLPVGGRELQRHVPAQEAATRAEIKSIRKRAKELLKGVSPLPSGSDLVLTGGAATALAIIAREKWALEGETFEDVLSKHTLERLVALIAPLSREERKLLPGQERADRSDILLHAAIALGEWLVALGVEQARVTRRGLPHGVLESERLGVPLSLSEEVYELPSANFYPLTRTDRDGEVLFVLRRSDGRLWLQRKFSYPKGVFRIPGGGVDHGEDSRTAVLREIREETGLHNPRPIPLSRIRYRGPGASEPIGWFSDLFLVDLGDHLPVPEDEKEGIEVCIPVEQDKLEEWIERLEALGGDRHAWGLFRAAALHHLARLIERRAL